MSTSATAAMRQAPRNKAQQNYIKTVTDALNDGELGRLTLVVGAGVTLSAIKGGKAGKSEDEVKSRLKGLTWKGLLLGGLDYLEEEGLIDKASPSEQQEHDFYRSVLESTTVQPSLSTMLRAASFLKGQLVDRKRLPVWLNDEFGTLYHDFIGKDKQNDMLDAIRELYNAKARIITTNYDDVLSMHCGAPVVLTDKPESLVGFFDKSDARRPILHIHGVWNEPQGAVLDGVDYFKVNQDSFIVDSLRTCLRTSEVLLFVGTGAGLDDPTFGRLLDWADQTLSGGTKRQYLLGPNGTQTRDYLNVIHYGATHDELPSFLRSLAPRSNQNKFYVSFDGLIGAPIIGNFCGRKEALQRIRRHLHPVADAVRQKVLVLYGLGGIGKTQLALEYAKQSRDDYTAIFWLKGKTEHTLSRSIAGLAKRIPLPDLLENGDAPHSPTAIERATAGVLDWLRLPGNFRWLMIIDNVGSYDNDADPQSPLGGDDDNARQAEYDVGPYFEHLGQGTVIITTRPSYMAQLGTGMEVPKMSLDDGVEVLKKSCHREAADEQEYRDIATRLDGLPLALNTAGCYILSMGVSLKGYLEKYTHNSAEFLKHKPRLSRYETSIMTTWESSLAAAEQERPDISQFLGVCACLDHTDLSFELFKLSDSKLPAWLRNLCKDQASIDALVGVLSSLNFFQLNLGVEGSRSIHSVVAEWLRKRLTLADLGDVLSVATAVIAVSKPKQGDANHWKFERRLMPHVDSCISLMEHEKAPISVSSSIYEGIGLLLYHQGRPTLADKFYELGLENLQRESTEDQISILCLSGNRALNYQEQHEFAKAEALYAKVLTGFNTLFGENTHPTLTTRLNIAENYLFWGKLEESENWYLETYDLIQATEDANFQKHLHSTVHGLANVYSQLGDYEAAEANYMAALDIREKRLGRNDPRSLTVVQNLALNYDNQGKTDKAEVMYRRCYEGYREELGPANLKTYRAAGNLAQCLHRRCQLHEALELYEYAHQGVSVALGPRHKESRDLQHNWDVCLSALAKVQAKMDETGLSEQDAITAILEQNRRHRSAG